MQLAEVMKAVEQFSPDELRQLREFIQVREQQELRSGTMNVEALMKGLEEIRRGLTDQESDDIERAMNYECGEQ